MTSTARSERRVEALIGGLADAAPDVRRASANGLGLLFNPTLIRRRLAEGVEGRLGSSTRPRLDKVERALVGALDDPDVDVRLQVVAALAYLAKAGKGAAPPALILRLKDDSPWVCARAAHSLSEFREGLAGVAPTLLKAIETAPENDPRKAEFSSALSKTPPRPVRPAGAGRGPEEPVEAEEE